MAMVAPLLVMLPVEARAVENKRELAKCFEVAASISVYATAAETPEAADSDGDLQSCCNTGQARVTFQSLQLPPRGSRRQRLPSATTNPGLTMLSTAWTSRWHGNPISAIVKHRAQFRGETGAEIEKVWSWDLKAPRTPVGPSRLPNATTGSSACGLSKHHQR